MKINKIYTALAAVAMLFVASCTKMTVETETYLEVNASNIHGNWELATINGEPAAANFYINFDRSGSKYAIWETFTSIPTSYNHSEGTFTFYTDPELGIMIRGIDSVKEEWSDMYVIKNLTKTSMTWVGVNDPTFVQTFTRISAIPFAE